MRVGVEIAPRLDEIEHGLHRHLVVAADGEVVLRLALARPVEDQRRHAAREERRLVGVAFLLGRIEADRHHHDRRLVDAGRLAQDAGEHLALDRESRRARPAAAGAAAPPAGIRSPSCARPSSAAVVHEQERREVVVDAGALQALAGGE